MEILFGNRKEHSVQLEPSFTIARLLQWMTKDLMTDPRQEMFVLGDGSVRPGILVLINDADWELDGGMDYVIREGDRIDFVSTLHGG